MEQSSLDESRVVVLWSGGLDSTTLVYHYAFAEGKTVYPLTLRYGQRHSKEVEYMLRHYEYLKSRTDRVKEPLIVDLSPLGRLLKSTLTGYGEVPSGLYSEETQRQTVVPNRNMILLSIAVGYAISIGAGVVAYAAHRSDYAMYPDTRPEFVEALQAAVCKGNYVCPRIEAPFLNMTKADIVRYGLRLGVRYELTWSCYRGGERPCLECGTCTERTEAFLANGVRDPLLTKEEWEGAVRVYRELREHALKRVVGLRA